MIVSSFYLNSKIKELNEWLQDNETKNHPDYAKNKQKRDYYVFKLIDLEENELTHIKL